MSFPDSYRAIKKDWLFSLNILAALQTVKENRIIKRKIIALKNDIEEQDK